MELRPQNFSHKVQNFGSKKSEVNEDFLGNKTRLIFLNLFTQELIKNSRPKIDFSKPLLREIQEHEKIEFEKKPFLLLGEVPLIKPFTREESEIEKIELPPPIPPEPKRTQRIYPIIQMRMKQQIPQPQIQKQTQIFEKIMNSKETINKTEQSDSGERPIILKIDERELARVMINIFNKTMKLNLASN